MEKQPILCLNNVSYSPKENVNIHRFSMQLFSGTCLSILGKNGIGKTTFLNLLAGLIRLPKGTITLNNQLIANTQSLIGFAPEIAPLYPELTVMDYLSFLAKLRRIDQERVEETLTCFQLTSRRHSLIQTLSKGGKQLLNLAQATLHQPILLLLDEPTQGLDQDAIAQLQAFLQEYRKDRVVIFSTHAPQELQEASNQTLVFSTEGIT